MLTTAMTNVTTRLGWTETASRLHMNTLPNTVETTTHNKPDGNINTPDARMAEPSSKFSNISTSSACSYEGSIPKFAAVSTTVVATNSVCQVGCEGMVKHVSESCPVS